MCGRFALFLMFMVIKSIYSYEKFTCEEDGMIKKISLACDGVNHCLHGSDESYMKCKVRDQDTPDTFFCAYGGRINQYNDCNQVAQCADKSDESASLCEDEIQFKKTKKGNCKEGEMECLSGDCIPEQKMCDGSNDCIDGRDESVDLCMKLYKSGHFQCANGNLIEKNKTCDNTFDCPDGSDELLNICDGEKYWIRNPPKLCVEPTVEGLRFTGETKYHSANGTRFVYANQAVVLECFDRNAKMYGSQWNVCLYTGEWKNRQIECRSKPKNTNPNTNGINGCPIDTYIKDILEIYKCVNRNCSTRVEPPINNMTVKFACAKYYELTPLDFGEKELKCSNKQWGSNNVYFKDPVCKKPCNRKNLYCRDSMHPRCTYNGHPDKNCRSLLWPGTKATFYCNYGYKENLNMSKLELKCLEDGNWSNNPDMDKFCQLDCG
ncbi:modular serine protease-like [Drosophila montana]|uniref:modular serine protease-like n=1 Tax=Drosophila montana TaxID=40370 RepID=UPI00313C7354